MIVETYQHTSPEGTYKQDHAKTDIDLPNSPLSKLE